MTARSHSVASRPCHRRPNSSRIRAMTVRPCANGWMREAPKQSSHRAKTAKPSTITTRPSTSSATSSNACSAASKTGGASPRASIATLKPSWLQSLRLIAGAERTIFLIVDRGPAHRAKKTKAFVETLGGRLKLFFLPPYSPDRNPDELVWKHLKTDTVGRMVVTDKADFKSKVVSSMRSLQKNPKKIC